MTLTGRTLGRYRLDTLLGQGGMADVYRATDTKLGRVVAVKVINRSRAGDPQFQSRFTQEARLVASLEHPGILPIYDYGEEDELPYLVMPYLDGGTLRDRMLGQPVPFPLASAWIRQLGDALDAAHAAGILHRDIKPANVLIGKGDRLALADFGIAKMLEATTGLTATGMVVGTPVYMAPEQAQGKPASPASDRYALGILSYELLAGRPPFDGESALALMNQHVTMSAPPLSSRVRGLPAGLDAIFEKALAKDPAQRHASCRALADAVAAFLPTGEHPTADVPTVPTSSWAPHLTSATAVQSTPGAGSRLPAASVTPAPRSLTSEATVAARTSSPSTSRRWAVPAIVGAVIGAAAILLVARGSSQKPSAPVAPVATATAPPSAPTEVPVAPTEVPTPAPIQVVELAPTARALQTSALGPTPPAARENAGVDVPPPPELAPPAPGPPESPEPFRSPRGDFRCPGKLDFVKDLYAGDPGIVDLIQAWRFCLDGKPEQALSSALNAHRKAAAGPVRFAAAAFSADMLEQTGKTGEAARWYREAFSTKVRRDELPEPGRGRFALHFKPVREIASRAASFESATTGRPVDPEQLLERACAEENALACRPGPDVLGPGPRNRPRLR